MCLRSLNNCRTSIFTRITAKYFSLKSHLTEKARPVLIEGRRLLYKQSLQHIHKFSEDFHYFNLILEKWSSIYRSCNNRSSGWPVSEFLFFIDMGLWNLFDRVSYPVRRFLSFSQQAFSLLWRCAAQGQSLYEDVITYRNVFNRLTIQTVRLNTLEYLPS